MSDTLDLTAALRELGRGARTSRALTREAARALFAAMLAGTVDELRLGALLIAYRIKGETAAELAGMLDAAQATLTPIMAPSGRHPVAIASYNGARRRPNLVPLLALSLAQRGVPVLVHGERGDGYGRVGSALVFAALGIRPCASLGDATAVLRGTRAPRVAFVPIDTLSPPLAALLALRERLGLRNSAHTIVKLIDPFATPGLRLVNYTHPPYREALLELFTVVAPPAAPGVLLARGSDGEAAADPTRDVEVVQLVAGTARTVIEAAQGDAASVSLPAHDAVATARYTEQALAGAVALPAPLTRQIETIAALSATAAAPPGRPPPASATRAHHAEIVR